MKYDSYTVNNIIDVTKKYEAKDYLQPSILMISNILILLGCIFALNSLKNTKFIVPMIIITGLIIARNFMVFHDLCHANYFPSNERKTDTIGINKNIGYLLDFIYCYPANVWIKTHTSHHKVHGNIDEHDEARTLITSDEYLKQPYLLRRLYDILRHPIFFYIIAPLYVFFIRRIIDGDIIFLIKFGIFFYLIKLFTNIKTAILVFISYYIAGIFGVILFHLQHSMNEPSWSKHFTQNDKDNAELNGSSVLKIPFLLKPFTNGIEYHNVHHINPGVPSYNIKKCYEELRKKKLLHNKEYSLMEMFEGLSHTLYDSKKDKYVYHYNLYY